MIPIDSIAWRASTFITWGKFKDGDKVLSVGKLNPTLFNSVWLIFPIDVLSE